MEPQITRYGEIGQARPSKGRSKTGQGCTYRVGSVHGRTPQDQLEVVLQQDGQGRWDLTLVAQGWGAGIGWYPQKTIALDASQIEPLQRLLAIAQGVTRRSRRTFEGEGPPLPVPASEEKRRLQFG